MNELAIQTGSRALVIGQKTVSAASVAQVMPRYRELDALQTQLGR